MALQPKTIFKPTVKELKINDKGAPIDIKRVGPNAKHWLVHDGKKVLAKGEGGITSTLATRTVFEADTEEKIDAEITRLGLDISAIDGIEE